MSKETPSQTVGPFFAYGLTPESYGREPLATNIMAGDDATGERIRVSGVIHDGKGKPVADALVEIWQANAAGRYNHPADSDDARALDESFLGFGRMGTGADGAFSFETIKPGPVPGPGNSLQAPHLNVIILARGMLTHAYTRIYFDDETQGNDVCPVLSTIENGRRQTLIARRKGPGDYHLDIHLQGDNETVFFDV